MDYLYYVFYFCLPFKQIWITKYTVEVTIVTGRAKESASTNRLGRLNYHWEDWIKPLGRVSLGLLQRGVMEQLCTYRCKSRGRGGGGSAGNGRGFWCLTLSPCRAFDRAKRPRDRDIWLWPTEAWYQFRSSYQVRPSRLPESHAVGERYEVFICFNRHNPILYTVI